MEPQIDYYKLTFGIFLLYKQVELRLNNSQMQLFLQINAVTYNRYVRGERIPAVSKLHDIANKLDVSFASVVFMIVNQLDTKKKVMYDQSMQSSLLRLCQAIRYHAKDYREFMNVAKREIPENNILSNMMSKIKLPDWLHKFYMHE